MKNNFTNILINIIFIYIISFIFIYSSTIKENIIFAMNIWINTLIPSIFPFLLLSSFLINYGFIDLLCLFFGNIIEKIFFLPQESSFAIVTSIFTGFPTGAKYVKDLLEDKKINEEEANHLIKFTSYSNPLFVISGIGESLLNNKKAGYLIFFSHLLSGLLIGIITRKKKKLYSKNKETKELKKKQFIEVLLESINTSFKILINMLGIIIFFLIIISIINKTLPNNIITTILKGLIEMTTGINYIIINKKINNRIKASIIGLIISFNGLSVHFQTKSIIQNTKIKYKNYLIARIFHSILCFLLIYILYDLVC